MGCSRSKSRAPRLPTALPLLTAPYHNLSHSFYCSPQSTRIAANAATTTTTAIAQHLPPRLLLLLRPLPVYCYTLTCDYNSITTTTDPTTPTTTTPAIALSTYHSTTATTRLLQLLLYTATTAAAGSHEPCHAPRFKTWCATTLVVAWGRQSTAYPATAATTRSHTTATTPCQHNVV